MQRQQAVPGNGRPPSAAEPVAARSELDELRVACRRQAHVIEVLSAAVSATAQRCGGAEGGERRIAGRARSGSAPGGAGAGADAVEALEVTLPLDARAPGAARIVVEGLRGRVPPSVLDDALLVVSELVTNSVRHSGAPDGAVVVIRVQLTGTMVRLEVEDPGPRRRDRPAGPGSRGGGGFGLNLVRALSERWGLERVVAGGTRVWAQLARAADRAGIRPRGRREIVLKRNATQRASDGPATVGPPRQKADRRSPRHFRRADQLARRRHRR